MYDSIIIGKGPAGLQAAIYISRARLKVLVIGEDDSSLVKAHKVDNYFGFSQTINGLELLKEGESQAKRFGTEILNDHVLNISYLDKGFEVKSVKGSFKGKTILIATGNPLPSVKIKGIKDYEGKGVSYCTTCDGFFFREKEIGILGYKDYAVSEAEEMEKFSSKIVIYTDGKELEADNNKFELNKKKIKELQGEEKLERIIFEDDTSVNVDGLFVALTRPAGAEFARKLGITIENERIITDQEYKTNIPGIYAAGDCVSDYKQIAVAVGQGTLAARGIIRDVKNF